MYNVESLPHPSVESRPIMTVRINDQPVKCLFDTGSEVTLIDWSTLVKMPMRPVLRPSKTQLVSANNSQMEQMGSVELSFFLGGRHINKEVLVVRTLASKCIIGIDFMSRENVQFDILNRSISVGRKPAELEEDNVFVLKKKTVLKPWTEMSVNVICRSLHAEDGDMLIEPLEEMKALHEESIITMTGRKAQVCLLNLSDLPVEIEKGTAIARGVRLQSCQTRTVAEVHCQRRHVAELRSEKDDKRDSDPFVLPTKVLDKIPCTLVPGYRQLLNSFKDIFSRHPDDVGKCDLVPQTIVLKDPNVIASTPPYRVPHHLQPVATHYVDKLLRA